MNRPFSHLLSPGRLFPAIGHSKDLAGERSRVALLPFMDRRQAMVLAPGLMITALLSGQVPSRAGARREDYLRAEDLPHFLGRYHTNLGERLQRVGLERLVSSGTLREMGTDKPSVLTWELPGRFRLEKDGKAMVGALAGLAAPSAPGLSSQDEDEIIESLFLDRSESALYNVANGAAVRVIGYQVGTVRGRAPGYAGPYFDIFDITAKVDWKPGSPARSKRYFFDSMSGLLQRVSYVQVKRGISQSVDTHFSQWTRVQNDFVPAVIERLVDRASVARFSAMANTLVARTADGKLDRA